MRENAQERRGSMPESNKKQELKNIKNIKAAIGNREGSTPYCNLKPKSLKAMQLYVKVCFAEQFSCHESCTLSAIGNEKLILS